MKNSVLHITGKNLERVKALLTVFGMTLFSGYVFSQDIHFSQYYLSPLTLNPAYTGNAKADYRFFGNYRTQWRDISKAYNTYSAGGDMNFYPSNLNFSGGLLFVSDQSGGNLNVNEILPSIAFHHKLGGFNMNYGIQPGFVMKSINFNSHTFPNQLNWNSGKFDNSLNNYETNIVQKSNYLDVNGGIVISRRFGRFEPEVGAAAYHMNKPKETFLGNDNHLSVRQLYNAGLTYYLNGTIILKGYGMYDYTTDVSDMVTGLNVEYVLSKGTFFTNSVFAGFMWRDGYKRNPDAGIGTVGLNWANYTLGFSYDVTQSKLKTAVDYKGAFEIAFIYRSKNTRLTKREIPCERY